MNGEYMKAAVWYIKVDKEPEGPYSVEDLRWDSRITLTTLAWREGMSSWLPMKEIPELAALFVHEDKGNDEGTPPGEEQVMTLSPDPQPLYYVLAAGALLILLLLYFFYT